MKREIYIFQHIPLRFGIAESYIFEFYLIFAVWVCRERLAVLQSEYFGIFDHLADSRDIKALSVERIYISEYPSHPVCKSAECSKVKHKFRRRKVPFQSHIYKVGICYAVAEERENDIRKGAYHIDVLLLALEGEGKVLCLIVNFRKPWLYSENAHILCVFRAGADSVYIIHSASLLRKLHAVSVSESADFLIYKESDNRCRKHNGDNPKVEPRKHCKINCKSENIFNKLNKRVPYSFRCASVAAYGIRSALGKVAEFLFLGIRI